MRKPSPPRKTTPPSKSTPPRKSTPPGKSTPKARFAALPEARRAALLDPAEAEFAEKGYEGASLNRILASAGISKGQAYHYIADKAELYAAVMERAFARFQDRLGAMQTAQDAAGFWAAAEAMSARISVILQEDARLAALARGAYGSAAAEAALAGILARLRAGMEAWLARGQALGAVREDLPRDLLGAAFFAAAREVDRWFAAQWDDLDAETAGALNARAMGMLRAMAAP